MRLWGFSNPFRRKAKRKQGLASSQLVRLSRGAAKTIRLTAAQYHTTLIGAGDLLCEKGSVKLAEEEQMRKLSPREMQLAVAKAVAEVGIRAKAEREAATPSKK